MVLVYRVLIETQVFFLDEIKIVKGFFLYHVFNMKTKKVLMRSLEKEQIVSISPFVLVKDLVVILD